jgi:hypothetical protein
MLALLANRQNRAALDPRFECGVGANCHPRLINAFRAHLAGFGDIAPAGRKGVEELRPIAVRASHG